MDTKNDSAISDVPTFKVARVGEDRKRRGGAFSFLRGGGTRGSWSGATGGAGAGGGGAAGALGMSFSKTMLTIMLTAGIGSGAVYLGARSAANVRSTPDKKPAMFADKGDIKLEGDTSNLPSTPNTIPNSLGYLSGSRDGLTPEERAKKEAEAAAAAEAQRLADEEAARKEEQDRLAGSPAVDPNALLASAQADGANGGGKGSAFGKKFGSLSSSMGGGSSLSGGAGLSGGVNRQFGSGGAIKKGASGQLGAMKSAARPSYAKAGGARLGASNTKGFARRQLANANAHSRRGAAAGTGETSAADAGTAFDNNPGAGNVISGPGIGQGAGSSSGADSTPNSVNNGGPTGGATPTVDCGADHYQDQYGNCKKIKVNSGKDAAPMVTMLAKIAQGLLLAIAVLAALALAFEKATYTYMMGSVLRAIIGTLGAIVAAMGLAIMAMGDYMQGAVFTGIGGFIGIACFLPMANMLTAPGAIISAGAGLLLSQAAGSLKSYDKNSAPEAAQQ